MPKLEDKRKLCPRCGSPLMEEGEGVYRCHLCGYSKGGEGVRPTIKFAEPEAAKKVKETKIYRVTATGMTLTTELERAGVFVIADAENNTIWIWRGAASKPKEAYNAGTAATKVKTSEKLYSAKLIYIDDGSEPPEFPLKAGRTRAKKEEISGAEEEALSIEAPAEGEANIYLIDKGELKKIDQPVFTSGDSYLVDAGMQIWVWIGKDSSVDEKFSAAHLSTLIDASRGGAPKVTTVEQGDEPKELRIALGGLKIVEANVADTLLKKVEKPVYEPVLYHIKSEDFETINDIVYKQVPLTKDSLDPGDVFILDDRPHEKIYIWVGSGSNAKEKVVGGQIARKFDAERAGVQEEIFVDEGEEPPEFKEILGMD